MKKGKIYAYNTHYEIIDYDLGDFIELEYALTFYDKPSFTSFIKYYYDEKKRILYIPRGIDPDKLESWAGKSIVYIENTDKPIPISFNMNKQPRNDEQKKAINYLTGQGDFSSIKNTSQRILIMPPGYGKTYCATAAIQHYRIRTLIIMRTNNLREQWFERLTEYTDLDKSEICSIETSEKLYSYMENGVSEHYKIFIVTRRLMLSFMTKYGMDKLDKVVKTLGIGLKIFDEAHQEYHATFLIDYATNVKYTFYLTATFRLSSAFDNTIFQTAYQSVYKLQFKQKEESRHIIYIAVLFNSHPNAIVDHKVTGKKRGFDRFEYIEYEIDKGILENEVRNILKFFLKEKKLEGRTLILSSKKTSCDHFANVALSELNNKFTSCSYHTDNKVDGYKDYDIISATSGMLGTGEDIPGLRFLLNTEPFSSLTNTEQFSGRLRPYKNGEEPTYYIEFIDVGFQKVYDWYRKRKRLLNKKVKTCIELTRY